LQTPSGKKKPVRSSIPDRFLVGNLAVGNGEIALGCYERQGTTRYGGVVWCKVTHGEYRDCGI